MKIYADKNIERSIIEGLRRRRIEVFSARKLGYVGKPDEFYLEKASEIGRNPYTRRRFFKNDKQCRC